MAGRVLMFDAEDVARGQALELRDAGWIVVLVGPHEDGYRVRCPDHPILDCNKPWLVVASEVPFPDF
jgi:hypothetical protein